MTDTCLLKAEDETSCEILEASIWEFYASEYKKHCEKLKQPS